MHAIFIFNSFKEEKELESKESVALMNDVDWIRRQVRLLGEEQQIGAGR